MPERIYLDWNATSPLRPEAKAAMLAALDETGNPSSVHTEGRRARRIVEEARATVGEAVGARARDVIFTSGGTEANVLALTPGVRRTDGAPLTRLIVSAIEHPSVLAGGRFASEAIEHAPVTRDGIVDLHKLRDMLKGPPALVSVMLANNETGAIQPVAEIADIVRDAGGVLHVDAVQALGKIEIDVKTMKADLLTLSAHKIGGPKGIGALIALSGVTLGDSLLRGGGQEQGRRAGTENVAAIAGFGAAVGAAIALQATTSAAMETLRERLETGLTSDPTTTIFAIRSPRLPNTTLFAVPGIKAEVAVIAFDLEGIAVSSGSACSSGKVQPSHVLKAMDAAPDLVGAAIRLSWGWTTTEVDIDRCLEAWRKLASVLPKGSTVRA